MSNKWDKKQTLYFIQLYKKHECLWNVKSNLYKNKQCRETALEDIKTKMDIDGFEYDDIKAKIRVLRSTYYQEKKKIQKSLRSGAGTHDIYRPNMTWFDDMDEMMTKIENKNKTSAWDNLDSTIKPEDQTVQTPNEEQENISTQAELRQCLKSPKAMRSKLSKVSALIKNMHAVGENTEFYIFGASVAAQLNKLSEDQAILAQEEIQNVLTRFRLNEVHARSLSSSSRWSTIPSPPTSGTFVSVFKDEPVDNIADYESS